MDKSFKKGINDGIPIALGYFSVSFTFGLAAVKAGLYIWQAVFVSLFCLTSAGQFAGLDIMTAGGSCFEMVAAQLVINLRYSLMSIAVSQKCDNTVTLPKRFLIGYGITDEIFAVAVGKNKSVSKLYMYGLILTPVLGWCFGTLFGAILGNVLPDILTASLGIAIYGMFIAIILPPVRDNKKILFVMAIAVFISCIRYYTPVRDIITSGFTVIIASVVASVLGAVFFPTE
ncbi:MAG: AzlC family ABC transporter permease [Firmicutes bacterium]|nr:AzlC family ABC transporter permease [Bacillota bacterium]